MDLWIWLVVVGQLLMACVALVDKYIVTSKSVVLRPFSYAFWISVLSAGSMIVFLFSWIPIPIEGLEIPSFKNVHAPSLLVFALSITAGYAFFTALLSFFSALKSSDASDVVPVVGGLNAVFTLLLSFLFLDATLSQNFLFGFILLVVGTILVSHFRFSTRTMLSVGHAGLMYGVHYIAIKALFEATNFDTAFFWSRLAIAAVALSMLLIPEYYDNVMSHTKKAKKRDGAYVLGNKLLAGFASLLLLKAIEFGDVAVVQALGGIQYVFLLVFSAFCCKRQKTRVFRFREPVTQHDVKQKLFAIPLIVIGFFLLFV